jgi:hypothetical protein
MFVLSPEADMRSGELQVLRKNAFWFADGEARQRLTKGSLANKGRLVLRRRRTGRTRIIVESQRNGDFSVADSQWCCAVPVLPDEFCTQLAHYRPPLSNGEA